MGPSRRDAPKRPKPGRVKQPGAAVNVSETMSAEPAGLLREFRRRALVSRAGGRAPARQRAEGRERAGGVVSVPPGFAEGRAKRRRPSPSAHRRRLRAATRVRALGGSARCAEGQAAAGESDGRDGAQRLACGAMRRIHVPILGIGVRCDPEAHAPLVHAEAQAVDLRVTSDAVVCLGGDWRPLYSLPGAPRPLAARAEGAVPAHRRRAGAARVRDDPAGLRRLTRRARCARRPSGCGWTRSSRRPPCSARCAHRHSAPKPRRAPCPRRTSGSRRHAR